MHPIEGEAIPETTALGLFLRAAKHAGRSVRLGQYVRGYIQVIDHPFFGDDSTQTHGLLGRENPMTVEAKFLHPAFKVRHVGLAQVHVEQVVIRVVQVAAHGVRWHCAWRVGQLAAQHNFGIVSVGERLQDGRFRSVEDHLADSEIIAFPIRGQHRRHHPGRSAADTRQGIDFWPQVGVDAVGKPTG